MTAATDAALDPLDAPPDRFCDVVMEGGVTSGIIYASAAVELAGHYRFRNIGGSSIGALAAALTAAAEYRRRHGYRDGFDKLAALPDELAATEKGRTRLERLFIPQRRTRRLFNIFVSMLGRSGPVSSVSFGVLAALGQYWMHVAVAVVLALGVLAGPALAAPRCWSESSSWQCALLVASWTPAALLTFAVTVLVTLAIGIGWDLGYGVVRNDFGLCRGWEPKATPDSQDLAAFLHAAIQRIAGRDPLNPEDPPLTFRDLWNAPGSATQAFGLESRGPARSINLEMYASNLSHGRPYRFPLEAEDDMGRLFFRVGELERFFPKGIVHYLAAVSKPYEPASRREPSADQACGYLELPFADLPLVVAARLAMSFPVLISAIPLHAVDHARRSLARCWISDGGLCSNFPIHLFDNLLPMWPTFGISLHAQRQGDSGGVWLPRLHVDGRGESWDHGPEESVWKLGRFLVSLWNTTWRWNDSTMMRMPGVRDRVVRIYLAPGEGGVNIRMGAAKIRMLASNYGTAAARAFIAKFQSPGSSGWREHRWVRLNCALIALRDRIRNFRQAVAMDHHTQPLRDQIVTALQAAPVFPGTPLDTPQAVELETLVRALEDLHDAFHRAGDTEPYRAAPRPSLRIRHPT